MGNCYNNMANVYEKQYKYELALEYSGHSLTIYRKSLGEDHPDVGQVYIKMAVVYEMQSKYEPALEFYGESGDPADS